MSNYVLMKGDIVVCPKCGTLICKSTGDLYFDTTLMTSDLLMYPPKDFLPFSYMELTCVRCSHTLSYDDFMFNRYSHYTI